jgi:alpha-methylacyl-CoA racemase
MSYQPLAGVKVLDLGILIPAALTSGKLAALGADVVKVEQPPNGDRLRVIPPIGDDGESPQHMSQSWGKRSIGLDVRDPGDRVVILALARRADIIVENQLAGFWASQGIDFAALRRERPALIVCSVTGFGQTGPWASLPSHGLNMDALADTLPVEWEDGQPHRGRTFTSWGNELGTAFAAMAVLAAMVAVRTTGEGAWVDLSCWDALVEAHRADIAITERAKRSPMQRMGSRQSLYDTYLSSDGVPVLLGALEPKFWKRFCENIGRADLIGRHTGAALAFADNDDDLRAELEKEFGKATAADWLQRFIDWDVPGGPVLDVPQIMATSHFAARQITEGEDGEWPNVTTAIRWHHTGERAGAGLTPPPAFDQHREEVLDDWLG